MKKLFTIDDKAAFNFNIIHAGQSAAGAPVAFTVKDLDFNVEPVCEFSCTAAIGWCAYVGLNIFQVLSDMRSYIVLEMSLEGMAYTTADQHDEDDCHHDEKQDQFAGQAVSSFSFA